MNIDFKFYLSLFWRRIHYFLFFLLLGSAVGITLATVLPPAYQAEARLLVESATIETDGGAEINPQERLQIIQQRVLTRASILEMVNRLDVYAPAEGEARPRIPADEIVEDMRERISISVTGGVDRRGNAVGATIVNVGFTAADGRLAADVTNEVVDLFLSLNREIVVGGADSNVAFYRARVGQLDRQLAEKSAEILAFQNANPDSLPDSLTFRRSQQAAAQERLLQLQRAEAQLRDQRDTLVRIYEETGRVEPLVQDAARMTPEQRQLQQLISERDAMLLTLAPTHPRVAQMNTRISALEQVVNSQLGAASGIDPNAGQLTEYELRLADLDGQLRFIDEQQVQIRNELEELRISIEATPANAIALDTMQRDMANIRAQYDRFVALLAEAETAEVVVDTNRGERISVIENAIAPREPNSPNRPLLAAAGIGGGFFLGLAVIVLLELLNSSIRRPVDLSNKLGITPLGAIPHIRTRWEIVRRRSIILGAFAVILIAVPAGLWFVHSQITPLDTMINGVLNRFGLPLIS